MLNKYSDRLLKYYFLVGSIYLSIMTIIYFFGLKILDTSNTWTNSAIIYASSTSKYFASFSFILAVIFFRVYKDLEKYKEIIKSIALLFVLHGMVLIFAWLTTDFDKVYSGHPSLALWLPSYNLLVLIESLGVFLLPVLVYLWLKGNK